jgi:hypothetical protein
MTEVWILDRGRNLGLYLVRDRSRDMRINNVAISNKVSRMGVRPTLHAAYT